MEIIKGGCHCGQIAFSIDTSVEAYAEPLMLTCHCRDCQQITGTGHARSIGVHKGFIKWEGTGTTSKYDLQSQMGNGVESHFCGTCGTPVYKRAVGLAPDIIFLHAGILDGKSKNMFNPQVEIWMHSKPAWDNLC